MSENKAMRTVWKLGTKIMGVGQGVNRSVWMSEKWVNNCGNVGVRRLRVGTYMGPEVILQKDFCRGEYLVSCGKCRMNEIIIISGLLSYNSPLTDWIIIYLIAYRNGIDLTEAENINKRWQEYTKELDKKDLHDPDNHHDHSPRARHPGMWSQVGLRKHHYKQS